MFSNNHWERWMPSKINVVSVCSAQLLRGVKYFTERT